LGTLRATFGAAPGPVLVSPAKLWSPQNHAKSIVFAVFCEKCAFDSNEATRSRPEGPKIALESSKSRQERPRGAPRSTQEGPQEPPGGPQSGPGQTQKRPRCPKGRQEAQKGSPQGPRRPKIGRHEPRKTDQRTPRKHFRNQCSKGLSGPLEARRARGHVPLTIVVERRRSNG
jgi:hypothetical protein